MKEKPTPPQISPARFKSLLELETIDRGTKIYRMNDQTKTHWQFDCYWIIGVCKDGIMAYDEDRKPCLLTEISKLYIHTGHA